jgi:hypothetical protein
MAHWEGGKHVIVPAKPDANEEAVYLKSKGVEPSLIKQIQPEILHMDLTPSVPQAFNCILYNRVLGRYPVTG